VHCPEPGDWSNNQNLQLKQGDQNVSVNLMLRVQNKCKNILNSFNVVRIRDNRWY
jgi:hypothetical protein